MVEKVPEFSAESLCLRQVMGVKNIHSQIIVHVVVNIKISKINQEALESTHMREARYHNLFDFADHSYERDSVPAPKWPYGKETEQKQPQKT